ncbi:MAG TPA: helix-turn-helix transcriptional regulator [Candidatus Faecimonas intestinavium]|nr:helix-turn-helix transcriptional regulator [Candidatus Faecimonas intestinavium]
MEISEAIVKKINKIKQERNLKNYDLFELSGVPTSTISAFLLRETKTIRIENLLYICEGLNITLAEFFSDPIFDDVEAQDWKNKK